MTEAYKSVCTLRRCLLSLKSGHGSASSMLSSPTTDYPGQSISLLSNQSDDNSLPSREMSQDAMNDQFFTDACINVIQRCLFLILYIRSAFPLDQETLTIIATTNSVINDSPSEPVPVDSALHINIDNTAESTPMTVSPVLSPLHSPRSERSEVG